MRCLLFLLLTGGPAFAQEQPAPELVFHFERPAATQTPYTFRLHPDGSGTYQATVPALPNQPAEQVQTALHVSPEEAAKLFSLVHEAHLFARPCASRAKVADTGAKTLTYTGPDGSGSCTYKYSDSRPVMALTDAFQAMDTTLEQGRRLRFFQRYDRLSLGPAMDSLYQAAQSGRALEFGNIAPELRSLADDTEVLEKVRSRAATLLGTAEASGAIPKP